MKILFISAFYPPHVIGGWEQLARDINERLQARGHETHVLTSMHGVEQPTHEPGVSRLLALESDLYHYRLQDAVQHRQRLAQNLDATRQVLTTFRPDVVFVHVMFNLTWGVPWVAEQEMPGRVVYYVANDWPHAEDPHTAFWRDTDGSGAKKLIKRMLAPLPLRMMATEQQQFQLQFARVLCVSEAVRRDLAENAGIPPANMRVLYNGVETDLFVPPADKERRRSGLSLVYAGSLVAHKGVHTAVSALAHLKKTGKLNDITLDLVGSGHPDYEAELRRLIRENDLMTHVRLVGRVPRKEMPALLQQYDVLLFPSIWDEPLSRMMQEGMAAGLVVVGTLTGGSGELLVEGETGLTFPAGDAKVLAQRVLELRADPDLQVRLARNGRQAVVERFSMRRMVDEIEAFLDATVAAGQDA